MSDDHKKKRPRIGADGEFIDPIPIKEKRKRVAQRGMSPFNTLLLILVIIVVGSFAVLFMVILVPIEPEPLPTLIPTVEPFALQVTQVERTNCDPVYAVDDDKISFVASENGVRRIHIYAIDFNIWCSLDVPILQHMAWNVDGSRLAFTGVTSSGLELFVMNADGSDLLQLTEAEGLNIDFPISWSTHDDTIAYTQSKSGYMGVYIINSDGTGRKLIYETNHPITSIIPRWGGGQNLIMSHGNDYLPADQPQRADVYIHDTFNDTVVQVTENPESDIAAVWLDYETDSPMLFRSDRDERRAIYRMRIIEDDSQAILLTPHDNYADAPIVSPDQREFMYLANNVDQLVVMSTDGSNRRLLVEAPSRIKDPQWSPDGKRIAYFLWNEESGNRLNMVDVDTGEIHEITLLDDFGNLEEFTWRPRAELLAIPPR